MSAGEPEPPILVPLVIPTAADGALRLATGLVAIAAVLLAGDEPARHAVIAFAIGAIGLAVLGGVGAALWPRFVGQGLDPPPPEASELSPRATVRWTLVRPRPLVETILSVVAALLLGAFIAGILAGGGVGMLLTSARGAAWQRGAGRVVLSDRRGPRHGRFVRPSGAQ